MRQLREFAQRRAEFDRLNVRIVGISTDDREHARRVWEKAAGRQFPILSDPEGEVIRRYGLLDAESAQDQQIAIRTTLLVDEQGIERWRLVSERVRDVPSPGQVLQRIREDK